MNLNLYSIDLLFFSTSKDFEQSFYDFQYPFFRLICRPNRENRIPKKIVLETINRVLLPSEVLELMSIFSSQSLFSRANIFPRTKLNFFRA